jgi:hypothetical protein
MWESNSSSIMSDNKWNFGFSKELIENFAKFSIIQKVNKQLEEKNGIFTEVDWKK